MTVMQQDPRQFSKYMKRYQLIISQGNRMIRGNDEEVELIVMLLILK